MRARDKALSQTLLPFLSLTTLARHSRWADDLLFEPLVAPVTQHRPRPRGRTVTIGCDLRRQTPYETAFVSKGSGRTTLFAQNYPGGASKRVENLVLGTTFTPTAAGRETGCGINASHTGNRQTGAYRFHVVVIAGLSLMHSMQNNVADLPLASGARPRVPAVAHRPDNARVAPAHGRPANFHRFG